MRLRIKGIRGSVRKVEEGCQGVFKDKESKRYIDGEKKEQLENKLKDKGVARK